MTAFLQQLFNFYFSGGWLWLALITLMLLIFMLVDNQRRQRQALAWILLLTVCLGVFAPSLFYSLSDGTILTQATREIFYAGVLGMMGAVIGLIGYVVSFQWRIAPMGGALYAHNSGLMGEPIPNDVHQGQNERYATALTGDIYTPQVIGIPTVPPPAPEMYMPPSSLSQSHFDNPAHGPHPMLPTKELAPGWVQDASSRQYPLYKGPTQIGREVDQDVRLTEMSVSRRHLIIAYEQYSGGDAFILQAIGQAETTLNGVPVGRDRKQLYDGDRIRLGTVELTFFIQTRR